MDTTRRPMLFMSHAPFQDERDQDFLFTLRDYLSNTLFSSTRKPFPVYADRQHDADWGAAWQQWEDDSSNTITFLMPIITPEFFEDEHCRAEFEQFLEREKNLNQDDLILPVYYADHPPLNDPQQAERDPLMRAVRELGWEDWRELRQRDPRSVSVRRRVSRVAEPIIVALQERQAVPEEASTPPVAAAPLPEPPQPKQSSFAHWRSNVPTLVIVLLALVCLLALVALLLNFFPITIAGQENATPTPGIFPSPEALVERSAYADQIAVTSQRDGNPEIYTMNSNGDIIRRLTNDPANDYGPTWSPDGRTLAFVSERAGGHTIYLMDGDGTNQRRLVPDAIDVPFAIHPTWSPDSQQVAFEIWQGEDFEIYVIDADGGNLRNLTNNNANDFGPDWSPDGTAIAFASTRENDNLDIYVMDLVSDEVRRLTNSPGRDFNPAWSPDGQTIAFVSNRNDNEEIYTMDADGTNEQQRTFHPDNNDWDPVWSADGQYILYTSTYQSPGNVFSIYRMNADGTNQEPLTSLDRENYAPSWCCPPSLGDTGLAMP